MSTKRDEELRYLISVLSARLLTNAAAPNRRDALKRAVRDWFPDHDDVDEFELRRITEAVAAGFSGMANLIEERLWRLVEAGRAEEPRRMRAPR